MRYYDNTRISTYRECPRKYLWRHEMDLVREGLAPALIFGLAWHDAMDVVWEMLSYGKQSDNDIVMAGMRKFLETWKENGLPIEMEMHQREHFTPRTPEIAAEMMFNYINERRQFIIDCELLAVERPFAVDLFEDRKDIKFIGRLDKVVKHPQYGILVIEHKTTSWYAKDTGFRREYLEGFSPNSQVDGYIYAAHMIYGKAVSGVWVDASLVHKTVHNKFRFIPVDRQFSMIDQWLLETRDWIERIENDRKGLTESSKENREYPGFPKDTGSCNIYAGCSYRDLCKFYAKPSLVPSVPPGYRIEHWEPFDILRIEKLGLEPENA